MPSIDLSKFTNVNDKYVNSGIISNINIEYVLNKSLKNDLLLIEEIEKKNNNLSSKSQALAKLQEDMIDIKRSLNAENSIDDAIYSRLAKINGLTVSDYVNINVDKGIKLQDFSISNINLAERKKMVSENFSSKKGNIVNNNLGFKESEIYFSKLNKVSTTINEVKAYSNMYLFNNNLDNLINNLKKNEEYESFQGQLLSRVEKTNIDFIDDNKVIINLMINNKKYISEPISLLEDKRVPMGNISFFCYENDMKFDLFLRRDDIYLADNIKKNSFALAIENDLKTIRTEYSRSFNNFIPRGKLTGFNNDDIIFYSNDIKKDYSMSPFVINAATDDNENSYGMISVQVDGEKYIAKGLRGVFDKKIVLYSNVSDNKIELDLKKSGFVLDMSDKIAVKEFEDDLNYSFSFNKGEKVMIEYGDSLEDIQKKINDTGKKIGVEAKILDIDKDNYSLIIESKNTGIENDFIIIGDEKFNSKFSIQEAKDSSFIFHNKLFTRSSNDISDLIKGVNIKLLKDYDSILNINIKIDEDKIVTSIKNFIENYNGFKLFSAQQKETDPTGKFVETAILGTSSALNFIDNRLNDCIYLNYRGDNKIKHLTDIGLFSEKNINGNLKYNKAVFDEAFFHNVITTSPSEVIDLLDKFSKQTNKSIDNILRRNSIFQKEVSNIESSSELSMQQSLILNDKIKKDKEKLLDKYTRLEETVMKANIVIEMLKAQQAALSEGK